MTTTLSYTGLGVVRRFNPQTEMVPSPELFDTPQAKWVSCELHWTTGFESLVMESAEAAKRKADAMGIPFIDRMAARKR